MSSGMTGVDIDNGEVTLGGCVDCPSSLFCMCVIELLAFDTPRGVERI